MPLTLLIGCSKPEPPPIPPITPKPFAKVSLTPKPQTIPPTIKPQIVIDSAVTLSDALAHDDSPKSIHNNMALVDVRYFSFDHKLHQGQIVVRKNLAEEVKRIFDEIEQSHFPIAAVVPISRYGWSDDMSIAHDNTSGFNYREVPSLRRLSAHAFGKAIDLNPQENPYEDPVRGTDQVYDPSKPGTLTRESPPTVIFRKYGWQWGGRWRRGRDYQHFEKP